LASWLLTDPRERDRESTKRQLDPDTASEASPFDGFGIIEAHNHEEDVLANTYNLFISHSWAYSDAYEKLVVLLGNRGYFPYKNYSVPKNDPIHNAGTDAQLHAAIMRQIAPCHCVIMLAGVYSTYSKWINTEIAICTTQFATKKPIVGINPWGAQRSSQVVQEAAAVMANWNTESIIAAIRQVCK
jgi:hypothetical protein